MKREEVVELRQCLVLPAFLSQLDGFARIAEGVAFGDVVATDESQGVEAVELQVSVAF